MPPAGTSQPRARSVEPRGAPGRTGTHKPVLESLGSLWEISAHARQLDKDLAATIGTTVPTEGGSLTLLVQEEGQMRESLHKALSDTLIQFEARQRSALQQHMRCVSQQLAPRPETHAVSRDASPQPPAVPKSASGKSPRRLDRPALKFGKPAQRERSPRQTCQGGPSPSPFKGRGNKIKAGAPVMDSQGTLPSQGLTLAGEERQAADILDMPLHGLDDEVWGQTTAATAPLASSAGVSKEWQVAVEARLDQIAGVQEEIAGIMRSRNKPAPFKSEAKAQSSGTQSTSVQRNSPADHHTILETKDDSERKAIESLGASDWREDAFVRKHNHYYLIKLLACFAMVLPTCLSKPIAVRLKYLADIVEQDLSEPLRDKTCLGRWVTSRKFEVFCVFVIIYNILFTSVCINVEFDTVIAGRDGETLAMTRLIGDSAFLVWYTVELALKIAVHRTFFFLNNDARFNVFDMFLVCFGWIDCLSEWSIEILSVEDGSTTHIPVELRILRIAKLTRILRALKAVKFLDQLRLMLELCMMSLISCFWVLLMIFFIVFVFSLIFSEGVVRHLQYFPQDIEQLACFEGVFTTSLTLLQSTTGGVDWAEPYDIFSIVGRPYQFVFLFYMLFFLLIVLNIVASVFLDRVMKFAEPTADQLIDERSRIEERHIRQLQQIFGEIDVSHDGTIQISEFAELVTSKKFGAFLAARGVDIKEAAAFFELVCDKARGEIDVIQVVKSCVRMKGYASAVDLQILRNEVRHQHLDLMDKIQQALGPGCDSCVEPGPGS